MDQTNNQIRIRPRTNGLHEVTAHVPLAAMFGYATSLRSRIQGRGTFTTEFDHYAQVPAEAAQELSAAPEHKGASHLWYFGLISFQVCGMPRVTRHVCAAYITMLLVARVTHLYQHDEWMLSPTERSFFIKARLGARHVNVSAWWQSIGQQLWQGPYVVRHAR